MGFEQLAALKEQLSKSAGTKAPARADRTRAKPPVSKAKPAANAKPNAKPNARPAHAVSKAKPTADVKPNAKPVDPVVVHIGRLQKRFPAAFPKNPAPKVALKIGIFEDLLPHIAELKVSQAELRDAIKIWCRGSRYWTALVENAVRVDLSGAEAGRVSAEDAVRAQKLEESRLARVAAKASAPPATTATATATAVVPPDPSAS
ncbi:ProQ/FINO family protein [Caballeronia sp. DA-9]|uniref:ProQ/FinO family protein n=1 Tax=Caballeronia sp. DA-9 TaxID=3436237 RepID=UPI003F66B72C